MPPDTALLLTSLLLLLLLPPTSKTSCFFWHHNRLKIFYFLRFTELHNTPAIIVDMSMMIIIMELAQPAMRGKHSNDNK